MLLLPMFDVKVDVTDDIVARFSWGKSIQAPIDTQGGLAFSGSPKTAREPHRRVTPACYRSSQLTQTFHLSGTTTSRHACRGFIQKSVGLLQPQVKISSSKVYATSIRPSLERSRDRINGSW